MKKENRKLGKKGEEIAKEYLLKKGYQTVDQNYGNKFGEIDLIMSNKNILVFIEVKLKVGDAYGTPEEMIGKRKIFQIQKTAEMFLQKNSEISKKFKMSQIDAVCIVLSQTGDVSRINHYENITF